jgi:membrane-bound inhibitor of C-type lysozyme
MLALCAVARPVLAERGDAPFVVAYRCDGGRWLAVGYPAYRDARTAPIRISYSGTTILLRPAMSGSGARYTNDQADLEWWSKGDGGFLNRLSGNAPILTNCNAS